MTVPAGSPARAFRAPRAVLLGFSSAALAVAAHGMAGGSVPDTAITVVLTALVGWAGTALAERNSGVGAMVALLGVTQLGLHVLLTHLTAAHADTVTGPVFSPGAMLGAHAVATVLAAVLLTKASAAFAAVAAAVTGLVRAVVVALSPPAAPAPTAPVETGGGHLVSVVLRRALGRRGPPVLS